MDDFEKVQQFLKENGIEIDDDESKEDVVKIISLIETWIDSFEKKIFNGKTLQELLNNNVL